MRTAKSNTKPKAVLSFRTRPETIERLRQRAQEHGTDVTALIETAIQGLLDCKIGADALSVTEEDISYFLPVIEKLERPVPLWLFLKMILRQRKRHAADKKK